MLLLSFIILSIAIFLANKNKGNLALFIFFYFLYFIISSIYLVSNYFTGKGIDESVIYHLSYGLDGAGLAADIYIIIFGILLVVSSFVLPVFMYKYLQKGNQNNKFKNKIAVVLLIFAFIFNPFTKNILELNGYFIYDEIMGGKWGINSQNFFKDLYKIPELKNTDKDNKNVIFIYLESFEKLYLDNELFPGLTNGLNQLKDESIYFDNINEAYGTSRTIAGMVGSQCGIPLLNSGGGGNSMHGMSLFLPGAFCIGDFLEKAGYDLNYIGGAKLAFAGKGNFYKTHGFNYVEGKDELISNLKDKNYQNDWGLYDDTLFDLAYKKYDQLSQKPDNFGLFMLNLDTHGGEGVISKECQNLNYTVNDKNSILNSYHCTDYLLKNFIEKIKKNDKFKNTIIVIASDHYAMSNNNSINILKEKENERKMLFLILDPTVKKEVINKQGTTLDIGATVLGKMGFDVDKLGLGVNLFSEYKTIQEQDKNFIFQRRKNDYESFWLYPSIKDGFTINIPNKQIFINNQNISFPALLYLDEKTEIEKILWYDKYDPISLKEKIPDDKDSIYIDYCTKINKTDNNLCILYTTKEGKNIVDEVSDNENISIEMIKNFLF